MGTRSRIPSRLVRAITVAVLLGLSASGCADPAGDPSGGLTDATSPTVATAAPSPGPTVSPSEPEADLVDGLEGTCAHLATTDEDLDALVADAIDPSVDHGPLVLAVDDTHTVVGTTLYTEPGVQGDSAVWRVDGSTLVAISEPATRITDVEADLVDGAGESRLAQLLAVAQDCSWIVADLAAPDPPEPTPEMRPELIRAEPDPASPGDLVGLAFPEETGRGIAFVLQRPANGGWETTHLMTSDANGSEYMATAPVDTESFDVIDVGVGGPGPDNVQLPDDLAPGTYRICTDNAGDEFCTELEIRE